MARPYIVFSDSGLLNPPVKRAAYSDRMALLMAEMAKLAYLPFENPEESPDSPESHKLDPILAAIKDSRDLHEARTILAEFIESEPTVVDRSASDELAETLDDGGFKLVNTYSVGGTQAFLAVSKPGGNATADGRGISVLSFRGTQQNVADWKTNLTAYKQNVDGVSIHAGFLMAFRMVKADIEADVNSFAEEGHSLYLTGHSLGGALALIATREIGNDSTGACYTFGSPRVAGYGFAQRIKTPIYRIVNSNDIVPRIPPVFLPNILKFLATVFPIPYQSWVTSFLDKFGGYVHHGDLRFLTRSTMESDDNYEDVLLLSNPNIVHRAQWWIKGFLKKPGAPINDHSIDTYCKKLKAFAAKRGSI